MKIIITGVAGFIGFHTAKYFYDNGIDIIGIDHIGTDDVEIKKQRLAQLPDIQFHRTDITDTAAMNQIFADAGSDVLAVVHLAGKTGVRSSFTNVDDYVLSNVTGFNNVIEATRVHLSGVPLVYASSSSVYGDFDVPKSPYGVTKVANELMANLYAEAYGVVSTGLRFFTVYGEWMRPDLAIHHFTKSIIDGTTIRLFNRGQNYRDYTYIADAVQAIELAIARDVESPEELACVYDIGTGDTIKTEDLVEMIEGILGLTTTKWLDMPKKGDSIITCADIDDPQDGLGYFPSTTLDIGLLKFIDWYTTYYDHTVAEDSAGNQDPI